MATNRRQQIRLSLDEQVAFFRERRKAALATIDNDGFPHVVAMNYVAPDGAVSHDVVRGCERRTLDQRSVLVEDPVTRRLFALCRGGRAAAEGEQ